MSATSGPGEAKPTPPPLLLASTSRYRAELLARLGLPFEAVAPDVDESPLAVERAPALAERLAQAKASAVASARPGAWVIGSDQIATCAGRLLGKPGTAARAMEQLRTMSGAVVEFHTAACLAGPSGIRASLDTTRVRFRPLSEGEIERYVAAERPLDCAGSFKVEGLGITLFESIESRDPTALVGLPLIETARLLREAGFRLP